MDKERLTWEEICKRFPNQQVALSGLKRGTYDQILSAVVVCSEKDHTRAEINGIAALSKGKIYSENTSPKGILGVGL
ncbi:MAG: hypothetical protein J5966_02290 [Lachnospiraceae bacterium]|nr:hypothetical protein [Lachnospiraceae bacterium]